jgi:peptidoglycan/LPS O-acetylase OafA/YrhL
VAVGRISYGLYLWHWPVYLILNGARLGLPWLPTQLIRFAVTFGFALLSYRLVERPALRLRNRFRPAAASGWSRPSGAAGSTGPAAGAPVPVPATES